MRASLMFWYSYWCVNAHDNAQSASCWCRLQDDPAWSLAQQLGLCGCPASSLLSTWTDRESSAFCPSMTKYLEIAEILWFKLLLGVGNGVLTVISAVGCLETTDLILSASQKILRLWNGEKICYFLVEIVLSLCKSSLCKSWAYVFPGPNCVQWRVSRACSFTEVEFFIRH